MVSKNLFLVSPSRPELCAIRKKSLRAAVTQNHTNIQIAKIPVKQQNVLLLSACQTTKMFLVNNNETQNDTINQIDRAHGLNGPRAIQNKDQTRAKPRK